jgi:lipopolysaccharide/colanic/teichoic acid biosynthesis glycosyltransferase
MTFKLNSLSELVSIVGAAPSEPPAATATGPLWPGSSGQYAGPDATSFPDATGFGADHAASARPRWRERLSAAERRVRDVLLSGALLVATLPVCLAAACMIKLESPGPVLYRQTRVGLNGDTFQILKLRSMRDDAEPDGPCWAAIGDPRVTRVGAWLRRARIDELPQLLNVLRGEMSLIGPRPERPHFVRTLAETLPDYERRTAVLPGITGLAQVKLPYGASVGDARRKLAWDLAYVQHRSLSLDVFILLATVRVVLFGIGAR